MQLVLTTAGLAAINAATGPVTVVSYKLGTAYAYTPSVSDTDIHGSSVYTGVPSAPITVNSNTYKYSVVLDATTGPFTFGEVGFYLPGNVLFAIGSFPTLQQKTVASNSTVAQVIHLDCYVTISGSNAALFLDAINSNGQGFIPLVVAIDDLPQPSNAESNLYNAVDPQDLNTVRLASSTGDVWTVTGYERAGISGTVVSASATAVRVLLNQSFSSVTHNSSFLQFFSGPLMGICRTVYDTAIVGTDTILTLAVQLATLPSVGDLVEIHTRLTTYNSEVSASTRSLLAGLNPTLTASELNQLDGQDLTTYIKADGSRAFTADQSLGGHVLTNSGAPINPGDLATKSYVDSLATGRAPLPSVRVASTANINLATPGSTIDGVSLNNGDAFLAKDQSTSSQNGIYIWNGASTPATRRTDFDTGAEMLPGSYFYATAGSTYAAYQFILLTTGTIVVGTTALNFLGVNTAVLPPDVVRADGSVAFAAIQSMGGNRLSNVGTPTQANDATPRTYVDSNFLRQDGTTTPTANLTMGGLRITDEGTPVNAGDAGNKQYIDAKSQGLTMSLDVRVASTGNLTLSSMPAAVDGVTLTAGDAFLAKNQTTTSQNGVYVFNGTGFPATRRSDLSSSGQVLPGFTVKILSGSAANNLYVNTTALPVVLNTTALTFTLYSTSISYVADIRSDGTKAFTADQSMGGNRLTNLNVPAAPTDAATKGYTDSNFARIDGAVTLTGPMNAGGNVFQNEGTPINDSDGANKLYVDVVRRGITQKADVKVASVTNINLSAPGASIDSIAMSPGDSFLAKNQTAASENGIYTFNGSGVAALRRSDFDTAIEMIVGFGVKVLNGSSAGQVWVHTTVGSITVGATAISFVQYTSSFDITGYLKADGTVSLTADFNAGTRKITNAGDPSNPQDLATKAYVDQATGNPSGNLNANGNKVINVSTPTLATDSANKQYADLRYQNVVLSADVRAASTANINLSAMPSSVDGVTLSSGDGFLAKNQTTAAQNGIYVFNGVSSAATRRTDFDTNGEALVGFAVRVLQGNTQALQVWVHTTAGAISLGTTPLTFSAYSTSMDYTGYVRLDGTSAFTGDVSLGTHKISNVVDPVASQDAATKNYTDTQLNSQAWKGFVRAASTVNISLSTPGSTIDGVTMVNGDSFLAKDQSTASQNGIYIFNGASSIATRRSDFSSATNVLPGSTLFVSEGNVNSNRHYVLTTDAPITVGSTALTFGTLVPTSFGTGNINSNGSIAFAADQSMGTFKLTNVGAPGVATDAANKSYVDGLFGAEVAKDPVRVASTGNIALSAMPSAIDGVTLTNGDSFLAKDQSTASQNGIYIFNGIGVAATRRTDFNSSTNIKPGSTVFAAQGSANQFKYYILQNTSTVTVDSTALAFNLVNPNTGNIRSDGTVPFGANQSMGGNAVTNVGTTFAATDAANRQYVDYKALGVTFLAPVRVASTVNITLTAPGASIDGVSMNNGDAFLAKNQTTSAENGVYIWNGPSSSASRRSDFNTSGLAKRGSAVTVTAGSQAGQTWIHATAITNLILGTTGLAWSQYAVGQDYSKLPRIYWDNSVATNPYTIDVSQYDEFQLTLTGNVTLAFSNPLPGDHFILKIRQDGVGSRTLTLPASTRFNSGISSYTPTATANALDRLGFFYDGIDAKFDLLAVVKNIA